MKEKGKEKRGQFKDYLNKFFKIFDFLKEEEKGMSKN